MVSYLDPERLTPGVLDGAARHAFQYGACGALAIAMHDATGWPVVAITDAHNVYDGVAGGGSAMHWAVLRPDGKVVDAAGAHDPDSLVEGYHDDADDGAAAFGRSSRADAVEWYVECQGAPIPISLAATFVDAVIENAARAPEPDEAETPSP